jgi:hypothetical protein
MAPDRFNDDTLDDGHDPDRCPKWFGEDSEGRPRPCLRCKPHLRPGFRRDYYPESLPSAAAQAAIEAAEREDP